MASLARARVERESVRVTGMHLQYVACSYTYKYGSKYGALLMRGLGGLLDCLDAQHHVVCPVCVPPGRGDCLCVFGLCFPPSM